MQRAAFSFTDPLAVGALTTLWSGQSGFAEARMTVSVPRLVPVAQALEEVGTLTHFGPVLRQDQNGSSGKDNLPATANVLWLDFDGPNAAEWRRDVLDPLGLVPTVVVFSGRGHWFHFKLSESIPLVEIEDLNERLVGLTLGGGDFCHDASRIACCPGRVSEKHFNEGFVRLAHVVEFNRDAVYPPEKLRGVLLAPPKAPLRASRPDTPPAEVGPESVDQPYPVFPWRHLNLETAQPGIWSYLETGTIRDGEFPSRSEAEMALVCSLVWHGRTDHDIESFFSKHSPARWWSRRDKKADLTRLITRAREYSKGWSIPAPPHPLLYIGRSAGTDLPHGSSQAGSVDRLRLLGFIGGQTYTELRELIVAQFDVDTRTVEKVIAELRATGVLRFRKTRKNDRHKRAYIDLRTCDPLLKAQNYPPSRFRSTLQWDSSVQRLLYPKQHEEVRRRGERARTETVDAV